MKATLRVCLPPVVQTLWLVMLVALAGTQVASAQTRDMANGNLIQFNDNGAWTWYSDERAVVDKTGGKLLVGVDTAPQGLGGSTRNGGIDVTLFDLQSGASTRHNLMVSGLGADDHNGPALMVRPDGKYLAQWTAHNVNYLTYFSIFNGTSWEPYTTFDWAPVGAAGTDWTSYSNPHYLSSEGRVYSFVRCIDNKSPHILVSANYGDTWSYYGKLVRPSTNFTVGYNPGYFRYCDNGKDRIDFICTEAHPRDYLTSIYHGYVSNGMSFKTDGTVVDSNLTNTNGTNVPFSYNFTPVFTNGTILPPGMTNFRCWNDDVQSYADGTIECIISARINNTNSGSYPNADNTNTANHSFFFCRYDGTKWTPTYLCKAGLKLYSSEADYVGLGCMSPNDPNTIYVSTKYDPRAVVPGVTDTNLEYSTNREIWKGVTTNHGVSFTWTPITQNSMRDNLRPIMPLWDGNNAALIWFRGSYATAQQYDEAPVGIIEHRAEVVGRMHYVDATAGAGGDTTLTNGTTLVLSSSANQWHSQTGVGNGGTILSSADSAGETPPMIMTQVTVPGPGTYDVWVNFWGASTTNADWRILAGLSPVTMQTYRAEKCVQIQPWAQDASLVLTNNGTPTNYLYQAYVGRATASVGNSLTVLVGGNAIQAGGNGGTLGRNTNRTWYDGVSYAKVGPFQIQKVYPSGPSAVTLVWNSPPPEMSLTTPTYTLQKKNSLSDTNWITVATGIPAAPKTYATTNIDSSASGSAAFYRVTWP